SRLIPSRYVLVNPTVGGNRLADVAVLFDRKLLLFGIASGINPDIERKSDSILKWTERCWNELVRHPNTELAAGGKRYPLPVGPEHLEVMQFIVVDTPINVLSGIKERKSSPHSCQLILSSAALDFILSDVPDLLSFVKFVRYSEKRA